MNSLTIIGNLTKDPDLRTTSSGVYVCGFTVAVNPRKRVQGPKQPETQYIRVSAWRELGENCGKFLEKGKKVCVIGPVEIKTYEASDGRVIPYMEVTAREVEFLSQRGDREDEPAAVTEEHAAAPAGFTAVETDELPF